jgi:sugar phosphate isomerase/epimerase
MSPADTPRLSQHDFVLCSGTLPQASLVEKIRLAGELGYAGISVFHDDYARALESGTKPAELRAMLDDTGVAIGELDPLMSWIPGAGPDAAGADGGRFESSEAGLYEIAEQLGGRSINAVVVSAETNPQADLAEAFAGHSQRASERGLLVQHE